MNAIIYGANGQDGFYLAELLAEEGISVTCVSRSPVTGMVKAAQKIASDVTDQAFVAQLIHDQQPDFIFNFAANSVCTHQSTMEHYRTIAGGTLNILEAVNLYSRQTRVFLSGSALQFVNEGRSIREDDQIAAESGYAAARNYSLFLARYYRKLGLKVYFGFFFHHESPHGKAWRLSRRVATAAREAKVTGKCEFDWGPIEYPREWNFAGDLMEAVWTLVNQPSVFEACLGCGRTHLVSEFANACFEALGLDLRDFIEMPERHSFPPKLSANPGVIRALGWQPTTEFGDLARLMVGATDVIPELSTTETPS